MAYFHNITVQGETFDLSHLDPFIFELNVESEVYAVHVAFSCHCFTDSLNRTLHTPDLHYTFDGETRAFSNERHALSLKLPDILRKLGTQSVYHTDRGTFLILRDMEVAGSKQPYLVFFSVLRAADGHIDVRLIVRSAYLKPNMSRNASPVKFTNLIRFTAQGRKPPLGPKRQIKRK